MIETKSSKSGKRAVAATLLVSSRQSFEALEGVVDEDPVLGPDGSRRRAGRAGSRDLQIDVGKVVKVGGVVDALDRHRDGRRPLSDVLPVNALLEEAHLLNVFETLDPLLSVAAELLDGGLGRLRDGDFRWKDERVLPAHDLLVGLGRALGAEGRVPDQHLEHDHPEGPPITASRVASLKEGK